MPLGIDHNRVALLAVVLENKQGVDLIGCDLFVNVAGGIELSGPSAIIAALVSSVRDAPVDPQTLVFGEAGLAGEARAVAKVEPRLAEAARMGFKRVFWPAASARRVENPPLALEPVETGAETHEKLFS